MPTPDLNAALRRAKGLVTGCRAAAVVDLVNAVHLAMDYPSDYPEELKETLVAEAQQRFRSRSIQAIQDVFRQRHGHQHFSGHYLDFDLFGSIGPSGGLWHVLQVLPQPHQDTCIVFVLPRSQPIGVVFREVAEACKVVRQALG